METGATASGAGLRVVDLGTKLGSALSEFRRRGGQLRFGETDVAPSECLGVDRNDKYRGDVQRQGYRFLALDVTAAGALESLPEADYYLAWDFLEHLPDHGWAEAVVAAMVRKARRGIWLRLPSFERDGINGEGVLKKHGLRFAWSRWHGHTCHLLVGDAVSYLYKHGYVRDPNKLDIHPSKFVYNTDDPAVVPLDAPVDTVKYHDALGPKPVITLKPPVVSQWEVLYPSGSR